MTPEEYAAWEKEHTAKEQAAKKTFTDRGMDAWTTDEVEKVFTIHSFAAPYCTVTRKADKMPGVLTFQHSPRVYYDFRPSW